MHQAEDISETPALQQHLQTTLHHHLHVCQSLTMTKEHTPFKKSFVALGVVLDLEAVATGKLVVDNTPDRIEALCATLTAAIDSDRLEPDLAQSLR